MDLQVLGDSENSVLDLVFHIRISLIQEAAEIR